MTREVEVHRLIDSSELSDKEKVQKIEQLNKILDTINSEKDSIIESLPELVIYQNEDKTWTRFKKTDNVAELQKGETVWRSTAVKRFTTEIKVLKNEPKENK